MAERPIGDMITVNITRQTTTVTRQGFGEALMLGVNNLTLTRVLTITKGSWPAQMVAEGFDTTDPQYVALSDYFAQSPSPNVAYIGRVNADQQDIDVTNYDVLTTYKITIDDDTATGTEYTSLGAAPAASDVAAALALAIDGGSQNVSAVNNGTVVEITADPLGSAFIAEGSVDAVGTGTIEDTATISLAEDGDDALTACLSELSDWYGIVYTGTEGRLVAQQKLVADWAEANQRLYIAASADSDIRVLTAAADTSTTIAGYMKSNSLKQSACIFHTLAATQYIDAAWFGRCLQADPGSINWNYKNLSSVTVDTDMTATYRTNMGGKGASWYETFGGLNSTQLGIQSAQNGFGDYIDVTRTIDWLAIRMQEAIAALEIRVDKVPFTNKGIASVEAEIRAVLQLGVENGAVASFTTSVPDVADVSTADKAVRHLDDVVFTAVLAGSINSVAISGTVTV